MIWLEGGREGGEHDTLISASVHLLLLQIKTCLPPALALWKGGGRMGSTKVICHLPPSSIVRDA